MKNLQLERGHEGAEKNTIQVKPKKYNVHGRIIVGQKPGATEISYYECDDIKCSKVYI